MMGWETCVYCGKEMDLVDAPNVFGGKLLVCKCRLKLRDK